MDLFKLAKFNYPVSYGQKYLMQTNFNEAMSNVSKWPFSNDGILKVF